VYTVVGGEVEVSNTPTSQFENIIHEFVGFAEQRKDTAVMIRIGVEISQA
jgi:hypothetical protein